jgi:acyl transferase domain-containing protein/D-arabinose 1-dehydrogenase-like Zn-dependent alcohol dehydrogenase/acyl carrier protein
LAETGEGVVIAAINGPTSVVLSGELHTLNQLQTRWQEEEVRARIIPVSYAAHAPQVEAIRELLLDGCSGIHPLAGEVPFYSAVTGGLLDTSRLDGEYWYRNLREVVRFDQAARAALADGSRKFVEVSPHPVLTVGLEETVEQALIAERRSVHVRNGDGPTEVTSEDPPEVAIVCSLRRDKAGPECLLRSLAEVWVAGASVDWKSLYRGSGARQAHLPTYAFQRRAYWHKPSLRGADMASAGLSDADHPLLGAALAPADGDASILTGRLSLDTHPWLSDHAVMGVVLLPGTVFLELALHAGARCGCEAISELTLEAPLALEEGAVQTQVVVGELDEQGGRSVGIYSRPESLVVEGTGPAWTLHASGTLTPRGQLSSEWADGLVEASWPPRGAEALDVADAYTRLAELGMDYGPAFQGLRSAWRLGEEIFAEVSLEEDQREQAELYGIHPALFDAALHGFAASLLDVQAPGEQTGLRLPFSLSGVSVDLTGVGSLRVRVSPAGQDAVSLVATTTDDIAAVVLAVRSLTMRPVAQSQLAGARADRDSLFRLDWVATAATSHGSPGRWAALGAAMGEMASEFGSVASGADTERSRIGPALSLEDAWDAETYADLAALGSAIDAGQEAPEIVLMGFPAQETPTSTLAAAHANTHDALALVQSWLADERFSGSRLVLLTRGAMAVRGGEQGDLSTAPLWGLIRSAQAEDPGRLVLVDLDGERASWDALAAALASEESQLAIREGVVFLARLMRVGSEPVLRPPAGVAEWRLETGDGGAIEGLRLLAAPEASAPLKAHEVRVAVRAAGLNFRDVVSALGLVSWRKGEDLIGSEGAGVVLEVGADVEGIGPGDRVMGLLFGAFGTVVVADRRMIVPMPAGWSFTRAASLSGAFLTAYYGLLDLAGLKRGERLLVHAAAGGVGMAAVQLAGHIGAEVWATASPGKWDALRGMGIEQERIASSRDLGFKERFLAGTDGEGVNVVLNSLAREYVDASCELLAEGGRLIEMGKTDIRDPAQVAEAHPGVSYRAFDLPEAGAERIQQMLGEILDLFERGVLDPLPVRAWDVRRAPEAFRFMSQARHVGKIVLTLPASIEPHGTALVTGGTGELGALVAKRLVIEHGIRSLLILSRRGPEAPGADALKDELTALGAQVKIVACEVSERERLAALIEAIPADRPLSVVIHSAGVLDDGMIGALTAERIDRVFAPKVDAAWHLHELTKHMDLQAFVLFSSASGTLGRPGQGNYAAANVFLDTLAAHRQAQGLAGISMAWGGWAQVSEMTSALSDADVMRVQRAGVGALSSEEGLALFDLALEAGEPLVLPVRLDLAALRAQARLGELPALLSDLVRMPARRAHRLRSGLLRERLAGAVGEERRRVALDFVCGEVATVLGHASAQAIEVNRAFKELGFDSLSAVEVRNRLNAATGLRLPSTLVFDYPTPASLTDYVLSELGGVRAERQESPKVRRSVDEPLAIVGMSCRYPGGVRSPQELWELVASGADAIGAFPTNRDWDLDVLFDSDSERPGTSYACEGGFVHDVADFDAAFFGISPREAIAMDPQQRLLLEASWEAIEDAGIDPHALQGSPTGVFVGIGASAYGSGAMSGADGFGLTGAFGSVASGRVAYTFGLEGPAVSIDTACSSSLVALHLAGDALRSGECSLALAGGVTVMSTPDPFIEFSRQRGLARDGRSKSFAASADGAGWGEGIGMLLVERLSDARRGGHRVLAVVRGSAINQDGASNGLTAPNGPAQQRVIRRALANAGLSAAEVDAVEAHGTGTVLGDPIEAQALLATYGQGRDRPLWLGSIKSNIGHAQHAAGAAGVIKMVMALRHEQLPRTLHVDEPSTEVDWSAGEVSLLCQGMPWKPNGRPRRAGVSSFGVSGTNAHVIIEEAPAEEVRGGGVRGGKEVRSEEIGAREADRARAEETVASTARANEPSRTLGEPVASGELAARESRSSEHERDLMPSDRVVPWVLSGRGLDALRAQAGRLRSFVLADDSLSTAEVGRSLAGRSELEDRAVVLGGARDELLAGLESLSCGETAPNLRQDVAHRSASRVAFLFTGQGAQRAGMGSELYRAYPVFREALDELCAELDTHLEHSLLEVMFAAEGSSSASLLGETMFTQAALFALEVSLFRLLESWGVRPDYLLGHSIGELAAAAVAEVFSLGDACRLVAARGRLMGALPAGGAMIAVQASEEETLESLAPYEDRVALAAVNGPVATVISGEEQDVSRLADQWSGRGRKVKRLQVSHAFHSPRMDAMLDDFAQVAHGISFTPPRLPLVSNLTGERVSDELCSPDYWVRQVRETVRFADGVRWLAGEGVGGFLEVGPDGALSAMAGECLRSLNVEREELPVVSPVLKAGFSEPACLLGGVAELWARGATVHWAATLDEPRGASVALPTYAFQRQRYWPEGLAGRTSAAARTIVDQWRYRVEWKPIPAASTPALSGTWLVALPSSLAEDPWVASLIGALVDRGAEIVSMPIESAVDMRESISARLRDMLDGLPGADGGLLGADGGTSVGLSGLSGATLSSRLELDGSREVLGGLSDVLDDSSEAGVHGVISLLALDEAPDRSLGAVPRGLSGTLGLAQALDDLSLRAPLWLVTRAAVTAAPSDPPPSPTQAQTWGLGATLALECPQRWGGLVDLPETLDERVGSLFAGMLGARSGEDQLAIRGAGVFARRLARSPVQSASVEPWEPPQGTVLITGGAGGLGAHVARWLARAGAQHLLLVSRSGADAPGARELQVELAELGSEVRIEACDVSDRQRLAQLIESLPEERRLGAVVHAAGAGGHGSIGSLTTSDLDHALSAKAQGALHLDELTADIELSAFVLFSSVAGTLGSGSQAPYAAANACLDALAARRRASGLPATSIAWGPWEGDGMAVEPQVGEVLRRHGLEPMAPQSAIEALRDSLARDESFVAVADIRWESYAPLFAFARSRPLIEDIAEAHKALSGPERSLESSAGEQLRDRLLSAPGEDRAKMLLRLVRTEVARVLGHPSLDTVDPKRAFKELGFDSLTAVELRNRLDAITGLGLPATLAFDYPTPVVLAEHLLSELAGGDGSGGASVEVELSRIERMLVSLQDSAQRSGATARLRALLARLESGGPEHSGSNGEADGAAVLERMEVASDEEIFEFIDRELGAGGDRHV